MMDGIVAFVQGVNWFAAIVIAVCIAFAVCAVLERTFGGRD